MEGSLLRNSRTAPTSCHYGNPTFKTFDLAINNFESDFDTSYLISALHDHTEVNLYYEHGQVDDHLQLNEEEIRELERVEAERMELEAKLMRKQEEIERMEQDAAEKRRREEEIERMGSKVRDWDEEDDDMEFEQSTQPAFEEMQSTAYFQPKGPPPN
ncbi:hypothetical protein CRG98_027963 [Punica granatum]|uniref:Uncharacterized protein n=1 Tax=Punica granatum TaxID=22663 RepID=A0A2I0J5Z2_PUNGR|nr:hypothetical protein CRG98_027963 [Punica granatum]